MRWKAALEEAENANHDATQMNLWQEMLSALMRMMYAA